MGKWWQQKTTWTGIVGIVTGVGLIASGETSAGIQTIVGSFAAIFLRQAVTK